MTKKSQVSFDKFVDAISKKSDVSEEMLLRTISAEGLKGGKAGKRLRKKFIKKAVEDTCDE